MSLPRFLSDVQFLSQLNKLPVKEEYVRITVLDWRENPIQQIQGIVINGNVNLDGNSSMRRTASLTVFAEQTQNDLQNINSLFAINKKCKLEKGIRNTVAPYFNKATNEIINYQNMYGDIVWFPLGIYVMFNPALSHQMTGVNISMQLKDKMCLLNGDLGGQLHSPILFNEVDEVVDNDGNSVQKNQVLIYNIIFELIHHYGNEDINKIFITEVPSMIKKVVEWVGSKPVYILLGVGTELFLTYDEAAAAAREAGINTNAIETFQPGRDIGFFYDDFTFPSELSCNAGDTITSVLDKIVNVLGNHEYFYDVQGNFIFQEKKNYLNMSNTAYWDKQTGEVEELNAISMPYDEYVQDYARLSKPVYDFSDNRYFTAYNNTLNYNNIKNDFIVWGSLKIGDNVQKIIRFHLAIDMRPRIDERGADEPYKCMFIQDSAGVVRGRYILKQSSLDVKNPIKYGFYEINGQYYQYVPTDNFDTYKMTSLEQIQENGYPHVKEIRVGDIKDWREQIYYQMLEDKRRGTGYSDIQYKTYFQYYSEIEEEFPKIFDLQNHVYKTDYYSQPDTIDYFLDIIDEDTELGKYSIGNIGKRTLSIFDNNEGINCVFEPAIPDIVYVVNSQYDEEKAIILDQLLSGYKQRWIQVPDYIFNSMKVKNGGKFNSCYEKIKELLYQYTQMNQTISITSIPLYHLEPNTRITINDNASGIYGDYIIQSISLPLDISSTMSINAYKAISKI